MTTAVAPAPVSVAEIEAFQRDGYFLREGVFSRDEVARVREACAAVMREEYATGSPPDWPGWRVGDDPLAVRKYDNAWKANDIIKRCVCDKRVGDIAAALIGATGMRLFHDQFLFKPAHGGKVVTWHQDWGYWQCIDGPRTVTCWIALEDVVPEGGPMLYMRGSHKLEVSALPTAISGDDEMRPDFLKQFEEVPVILKAGGVAFHHGLLFHGSGKNTSDRDRWAIVSHEVAEDARLRVHRQGHGVLQKMKDYAEYPKPGEKFHGPQFPRVDLHL
ncbi:MAG: phytanoyl-CoA dioxygenase family protein [Planctomycetota bacterium]